MARTTRGSPWPILMHINWLLKSRKRLPSGVQKYTPCARAMGMGSTGFWGAHSKIVCFLERAMISSPVIGQKGYSRFHADHDLFRLRLTLLLSRRAGGRPAEWGVRGAARVFMERARA